MNTRPSFLFDLRQFSKVIICSLLVLFSTQNIVHAADEAMITPNFVDADIRDVINTVSELTGKNFIIDQTINFKVNMTSATPMNYDNFYEAFLSVMQLHGYIAVPSGQPNTFTIVQESRMRQVPVQSRMTSKTPGQSYVTRVFELKHVSNQQLNASLRPIVSTSGHFVNIGDNKVLVIDRAANVKRIGYILDQIDQPSSDAPEIIPLIYASASETVQTLTQLYQGRQGNNPGQGGAPISFIADDRTNSIIMSGDRSRREQIRSLLTSLDTPLPDDNGPQVIYLKYADAETLAQILKEQTETTNQQTSGGNVGRGGQSIGGNPRNDAFSIIPDIENNALVITAPPKKLRNLRSIIDKLDIRRAQVQIEAMIVEVNADKSAALGITWAFDGSTKDIGAGLTNFSNTTGVAQIGGALAGGADIASALAGLPSGGTFVLGRLQDDGNQFAAVINALAGDADTNILSTPNITTIDNKEAEITVGEKVPFLTGSFTNTGAGGGSTNPFQTIDRQDVGLTLKVKPQVNEGGSAVLLEMTGEISSVLPGADPSTGLASTSQRKITTNVIAEDGEIIVLGGLINDQLTESIQRVPGLSRIPLIGGLFKTRSTTNNKRNLMIFLRPRVLRDAMDANESTMEKYYHMREKQLQKHRYGIQLMPGEELTVLPDLKEFEEDLEDRIMP